MKLLLDKHELASAMTVAVADWFVGYDWSITSVFLRLTVKPNCLAASVASAGPYASLHLAPDR